MLYLTTIEKELAYYVSYDALPAVQKNYVFAEQVTPLYSKKDKQVDAMRVRLLNIYIKKLRLLILHNMSYSLKSKTIGESFSKYQNAPVVISVNGVF